jgi:(1->4)-alpha-D-glucan 1-alpha-D-glucosylmutase
VPNGARVQAGNWRGWRAHHEWQGALDQACVQRLKASPASSPASDALEQLIAAQAYRLAGLAGGQRRRQLPPLLRRQHARGLRMERPEVFEATHRKVLQWLQEGLLSGLRIDHPGRLSDPQAYFEQLQARHAARRGRRPSAARAVPGGGEDPGEHESLPEDWPVHGDTGYRFGSLVNGLFVEPRNENALVAAYQASPAKRRTSTRSCTSARS